MNKPILISGIAPSGKITLGNYLGAIKNWGNRQADYTCFFPLVDLHAITIPQDTSTYAHRCRDFVALYLACGIDPNSSTIFAQSHVPEHCELMWLLMCRTQMGQLSRMTQFKDKSKRNEGNINAGLFSYPVLMAADILLYKANLVPVGADQKQHIELTRDIAARLNSSCENMFPIPETYIGDVGARIMSLQDPSKKMSKSDPVDANIVTLLDDPATITRKFKRSVTDSEALIEVRDDKPGISNLLNILAAVTDTQTAALETAYRGLGYGQLKSDVADAVIALIEPIQARFHQIRSDERALDTMLMNGADQAREIAHETVREVRQHLDFIPSKRERV